MTICGLIRYIPRYPRVSIEGSRLRWSLLIEGQQRPGSIGLQWLSSLLDDGEKLFFYILFISRAIFSGQVILGIRK